MSTQREEDSGSVGRSAREDGRKRGETRRDEIPPEMERDSGWRLYTLFLI